MMKGAMGKQISYMNINWDALDHASYLRDSECILNTAMGTSHARHYMYACVCTLI